MENAVQGFYIAAATLIALMVLSVLIYMFRTGATLGENYEISQETAQVIKFNSQFDAYSKITNQSAEAKLGFCFITKGNTASDIISCANLAMSVNRENDYDKENKLEIIVICGSITYSIYPLEKAPKDAFWKNIPYDVAKGKSSFEDDETLKFYSFLKEYNSARIVDIQSDEYNSVGETIYKYYFDVDEDETGNAGQGITYSDVTRKG